MPTNPNPADPAQPQPELIHYSRDVEVIKGTTLRSCAWLHAPAYLEVKRIATRRLIKVASKRGCPTEKVERVRASVVKGTKIVYLWPPDPGDTYPTIEVVYAKGAACINLVDLLAPLDLSLPTGQRVKINIEFTGPNSPVGPALYFDLDDPDERKPEPKSRRARSKKARAKRAAKAAQNASQNP